MDRRGFQEFLEDRKLTEEEISTSIDLAEKFEAFLSAAGITKPGKEDATVFSARLIDEGLNTLPNYYALARYGLFIGSDDVYVAVLDLLDGEEAMGNLHRRIGKVMGEEQRDEIFEGIDVPALGTPNSEKVNTNRRVMERLENVADSSESDEIFADSLRDLDDAWYGDDKKLYEECSDMDEFLDRSAQNFITHLEKLRDDGELFFSQEITDEIVEYVRSEPLIARGRRKGDILYEVKIPHQTKEFLAESDKQKKRYFYCHCPWVKESLIDGESAIPTRFCDCSAGFHKKRWEVIFEQPLRAEVVESVLKGDDRCMIAIHLPEGIA